MQKISVDLISLQHRGLGTPVRFLGETDKFLLRELPADQLKRLAEVSKKDFANALQSVLYKTGMNLAQRLFESPDYYLFPVENTIRSSKSLHSPSYYFDWWTKTVFWTSISKAWKDVSVDSNFKETLLDFLKQLAAKRKPRTIYLYGILVYARTLFEEKGGRWQDISFICQI